MGTLKVNPNRESFFGLKGAVSRFNFKNKRYNLIMIFAAVFILGFITMGSVAAADNTTVMTGSWSGSGGNYNSTADAIAVNATVTTAGNAAWNDVSTGTTTTDGTFFSNSSAANHASLQASYWWDTRPDKTGKDSGTGTITFTFSEPITNPILYIDRIGGTANGQSNSAVFTLTTSGLTLSKLSGCNHLLVTSTTFQRITGQSTSGSESSWNYGTGTAAGSIMIVGNNITQVTFTWTRGGNDGLGSDEIEFLWGFEVKSDVRLNQTANSPVNVGDLVTYLVTATNNGPNTATNIKITDIIPAVLGSVTVTPSVGSYNATTGIWTIPKLSKNASATLNITGIATAAMAGNNTTNVATKTSQNGNDGNSTNDVATATVYTKKADVVLSQTGAYNKTKVTFVVTARNTGPDTATQVNIHDLISAGLSGVTFTPSVGSYNSTSGVWTIPSLASGSNATLTITGTAAVQSTVTNNATQLSQVEYDPTVNSGLLSVYVPGADIGVHQYPWLYDNVVNASVDQYLCANTPVFMVHVVNSNSYDDATGVVVEYLLGTGYDYINCNTMGVGNATYNPVTRIITWNIGFMPKGGEAFLSVFVKIVKTGNKTAALTNLARLKSLDQYDMNTSNNESSYGLIVPTSADIQVSQTVTNFTNSSGSYVIYTITVANNGPDNATGLTITDKLPKGLLYVSDNSGGSYNKNSGIWTIGNFSFGEAAKTLIITAKITGTGTIKNSAVRSGLVENDWNYANNGQTNIMVISGTYDPSVDIRVLNYPWYYDATSQTSKEDYMCGTTPVFVMQVSNPNKYDDATGVVFEYVLGGGFEYLDCNTQGSGIATYDPLTHTITWNLDFLPRGGTAFLKVYTKVISTGNKTSGLTTIARLKSVDQTDVNTANNEANCSIIVASAADVQVTQSQSNYTVSGLEYIDYTVTVTNNGPDTARNVVVIDNLPSGVTYVGHEISYDGGVTWVTNDTAYNASTGTWNIGNQSSGSQPVLLKITVKVTATGTIQNTATKSNQTNDDWNYNNNGQTVVYARPN